MPEMVPGSRKEQAAAAKAVVSRYLPQMNAMLPGSSDLSAQHLLAYAHLAIANEPKLALCTGHSLVASVLESVALGLPIGVLGQCWLVPFKDKATLIIGYRGMIELAMRSNRVSRVDSAIVRANDVFRVSRGTHPTIVHEPDLDSPYGDVKAAYAVVHYRDGGFQFEVMGLPDLDRVRSVSHMKDRGAWASDPEEMYRKVPIRRLLKRAPVSTLTTRAADLDEMNEGISPHKRSLMEEQVLLPEDVPAARLASQQEVEMGIAGRLPGQGATIDVEAAQGGGDEGDRATESDSEGRGENTTECSHPGCKEVALVPGHQCDRHWADG